MKKFTESQKKWALTASLVSALSFNLVMSLSSHNISGMANLAEKGVDTMPPPTSPADATEIKRVVLQPPPQTQAEQTTVQNLRENSKLQADDGTYYDVIYQKSGDQTTVFAKKYNAEGTGLCPTCIPQSFVLDKKISDNLTDLDSAFKVALKTSDTKEEKKKPEKKKKPKDTAFDDLKDSCKDEKKFERLTCLLGIDEDGDDASPGSFIDMLTDSSQTHSADQMMSFFESNIRSSLVNALNNSNKPSEQKFAEKIIKVMLAGALDNYSDIRKSLVDISTDSMKDMGRSLEYYGSQINVLQQGINARQQSLTKMPQNANSMAQMQMAQQQNAVAQAQINELRSEGQATYAKMQELNGGLTKSLQSGLRSAAENSDDTGVTDRSAEMLYSQYVNPVADLMMGVNTPGYHVKPNSDGADGGFDSGSGSLTNTLTPSSLPLTQLRQNRGAPIKGRTPTPFGATGPNVRNNGQLPPAQNGGINLPPQLALPGNNNTTTTNWNNTATTAAGLWGTTTNTGNTTLPANATALRAGRQ